MDASTGQWIFHLDSDGQVDVSEFGLLWERRHDFDLVLGMRIHRHDPLHRLILTRFTRAVVSLLARHWVRDGNVPFKLIRRSLYDHLRTDIPETAFAPSIMIVIGAHRSHARVAEIETTHLPRTHGRSTLRLKRLAVAVGRSFVETLDFSRRRLPRYRPTGERAELTCPPTHNTLRPRPTAWPSAVLVTGGAGFIGCNVVRRLVAAGLARHRARQPQPAVLGRERGASLEAELGDGVRVMVGDVADAYTVASAMGSARCHRAPGRPDGGDTLDRRPARATSSTTASAP